MVLLKTIGSFLLEKAKKLFTNTGFLQIGFLVVAIGFTIQSVRFVSLRNKLIDFQLINKNQKNEIDSLKIVIMAERVATENQILLLTKQMANDKNLTDEARKELDSLNLVLSNDTISLPEAIRTVNDFIKRNSRPKNNPH